MHNGIITLQKGGFEMMYRTFNIFSINANYEQKLTLLALCDHANQDGLCPISFNFFVKKIGMSRWRLIRNLTFLERSGYIECIERRTCYKIKI